MEGIYGMRKDGLPVGSRSKTVFFQLANFEEKLNGFSGHIPKSIMAHIMRFQIAWCASRHDGDLPSGYCAEQDKEEVDGPYQLYQIRVGPNHGYRAWIMFLDESSEAYWVHIFKKVKDRQPEDMDRARVLARRHWNKIRRGRNATG